MYAEQKSYEPLDTETSQQGRRLRFGHLTPLLMACLMFIVFVAVSIASSTSGDSYSCSSIIFLFRDAGSIIRYYRFLNILGCIVTPCLG